MQSKLYFTIQFLRFWYFRRIIFQSLEMAKIDSEIIFHFILLPVFFTFRLLIALESVSVLNEQAQ